MILTVIIGIIVAVCLVSTLIVYAFKRAHENSKSPSTKGIHLIKNTIIPKFGIIIRRQTADVPLRSSISSDKSNHSSTTTTYHEEKELIPKKPSRSIESLTTPTTPIRSTSMVTNFLQVRRPGNNWRQGSIVDCNQIAAIQFTLPSITTDDKYRRRSVPIFHSLIDPRENPLTTIDSTLPCLLSFSITYLKSSQLRIQFNSLQGLSKNIHLQQLTIKVKLIPDGKEKSIQIKKYIQNETKFENELCLFFSNIHSDKLHEKSLTMTIHGKDRTKKTVHLGQIGKIIFNQINQLENENRIEFTHEIEKSKASSVELLVSLQKKDDRNIHVDLERIKGLKIDQKKLDAQCYLQILLLDHHRPLITKQTKFYRLNSSNFTLGDQYDFNILTFNSNNLDRFIILFSLYSNSNHTNEYKRIAHIKLASPVFCSGSGNIHWQQFKARESFSMWHTFNKQQN